MEGYGNAAEYAAVAADSFGVSAEKMAVYEESLEGKSYRMKAAFEQMANTILDSGLIGALYDIGTAIAHFLTLGDGFLAKFVAINAAILTVVTSINMIKASPIGAGFVNTISGITGTYQYLQALGTAAKSGIADFTQWSSVLSRMTSAQLSNIVVTNAQTLGIKALNEEELKKQLMDAGVSESIAKATAAQVAQTTATNAQAVATETATVATGGLSAAWAGLKAIMAAHPFLTAAAVIGTLVAAFNGFLEILKNLNVTYEEHREKTDDLISEYKELAGEIDEINSKLSENEERIKQLNKIKASNALSLAQKEELEDLQKENEILQVQLEIREKIAKQKAEEANKALADEFQKGFIEDTTSFVSPNGKVDHNSIANAVAYSTMTGQMSPLDIDFSTYSEPKLNLNKIQQIEYWKEELISASKEIEEAITTAKEAGIDWENATTEEAVAFSDKISSLQEQANNAKNALVLLAGDFEDEASRVQDQTGTGASMFEEFMEYAQKALDASNWGTWSTGATDKFSSIWNSEKYADTRKELEALNQQGRLTAQTLGDDAYSEFVGELERLGIIGGETGLTLNDIVAHIRSMNREETAAANGGTSALAEALSNVSSELTITEQAMNSIKAGNFDEWILEDKNLENLLKELPEVRDALNEYAQALANGEKPGRTLAEVQSIINDALKDTSFNSMKDGIASLQTAYKELSEDGSITYSTLTKIATQFADVKGIKGYITQLAGLKGSSAEAQAVMNDMIDALVSAKLASIDLANADEGLIAALLDEVGVADSAEQAHRIVVLAKAEHIVETYALKDATEQNIASLQREIEMLFSEGNAAEYAGKYINAYKIEKTLASDTQLNNQATIDALIAEATAAGVSVKMLQEYKDVMQEYEQDGYLTESRAKRLENLKQRAMEEAAGLSAAIYAGIRESSGSYSVTYTPSKTSSSSSSASKSTKEVEEYTASLDKFYKQLQNVKRIEDEIERENAKADLLDSNNFNAQIKHHQDLISMYQQEQDALHELADARRSVISQNIQELTSAGFDISYNSAANTILINNMERINELQAKSKGNYDTLQEATNDYRKEMEDLIDTTIDMVEANRDNSDSWWDLEQSIKSSEDAITSAKESIVDALKDITSQASNMVDEIQNAFSVLKDAANDYASNGGALSVDSYQKILELGPQYISLLEDENGLLVINEEKIKAVIAARTEQLAVESAMAYVERLRLALQDDSIEDLNELLGVTVKTTSATWGLVYANLAMLKTMGLTNEQYQQALHNINGIRSMAESAVYSIYNATDAIQDAIDELEKLKDSLNETKEGLEADKEAAEDLLDTLEDMKDGVDDYVSIVEDYVKYLVEEQIDALEQEKDIRREEVELLKKQLDTQKEIESRTKSQTSKLRELAKLQARADALAMDTSREAAAERAKVLQQIYELQDDLNEEATDAAIDARKDELDAELESFEDEKDAEIEKLKDSISSAEKLYRKAIEMIRIEGDALFQKILDWNYQSGNLLEKDLLKIFETCEQAADRYGSLLNAVTGAIDTEIDYVSQHIKDLSQQIKDITDQISDVTKQISDLNEQKNNLDTNVVAPSKNYEEEVTAGENNAARINQARATMKQNAIDWWTQTTTAGQNNYANLNTQEAAKLEAETGYKVTKVGGAWYDPNGNTFFEISKNDVGQAVVSKMLANSYAWHSATAAQKKVLEQENQSLAANLAKFLGTAITYNNGEWYIKGQRLYDVSNFDIFHSGGIAGNNPTLKQDEVMAKLKKGEAILDEKREQGLYKIIDFVDSITSKIGNLANGAFLQERTAQALENRLAPVGVSSSAFNNATSVQFGDVVINGAGQDTVRQHQEVNRKFVNDVIRVIGLRR